jgi:protein O-mannosyl-transferase
MIKRKLLLSVGFASQRFCGAIERPQVCFFLLMTTVLSFFLPALSYSFIYYDDPPYVFSNDYVVRDLSWRKVIEAFGYIHTVNWHPLTSISHALDYHFFGMSAGGHHLVSLIFHAASSGILYLLLQRVFKVAPLTALLLSLFFGLHPMRLESVIWISERKDVLSLFFLLLSILFYCNSSARRASANYVTSIVFFVFACLSKSSVVVGAPILLMLSWWPLGRLRGFPRDTLIKLAPFFVLSLLTGIVAVITHKQAGNLAAFSDVSVDQRFGLVFQSLYIYWAKLVWPSPIALVYPIESVDKSAVLLYFSLFLLFTGVALVFRRTAPYLLLGWAWYLFSVVPVSGLVQNGPQAYADRYSYLSHCGLLIAVACFMESVKQKSLGTGRLLQLLLSGCLVGVSVITALEMPHWKSNVDVMRHTVEQTQANHVALVSLSASLIDENRMPEALPFAQRAYELRSENEETIFNLGLVYLSLGNLTAADTTISVSGAMAKSPLIKSVRAKLLLQQRRELEAVREMSGVGSGAASPAFMAALLKRFRAMDCDGFFALPGQSRAILRKLRGHPDFRTFPVRLPLVARLRHCQPQGTDSAITA